MADLDFTAGITFADNRVATVDVSRIDGEGIAYRTETGDGFVPWLEVKAVMLATTDHMLESGGSLFAMAEVLEDTADPRTQDAARMRQFGFGILRGLAPRVCPRGSDCGLGPSPAEPVADV